MKFTGDLKFGLARHVRAAELYFDGEMAYRAVGREMGVTPLTVFRWVNGLGAASKSFVEVAEELKPRWGGWLYADGKSVYIKGVEHALLLTADHSTLDIPTARLAPSESEDAWKAVFLEVREELSYPLRGLILDGDNALLAAARAVFPETPIQLCLRHAQVGWPRYFTYSYEGPMRGVPLFLELADRLVHVRTRRQRRRALAQWQSKRAALIRFGLRDQIERLEDRLPLYFTFLRHPGMPPTDGLMESIIRQLDRKIEDTDGFETKPTAWNSLKMLIMRYRFHRFSCSRVPGRNGRSPLELAGVQTNGLNWVRYSVRVTGG